jgi:hypothetical protein
MQMRKGLLLLLILALVLSGCTAKTQVPEKSAPKIDKVSGEQTVLFHGDKDVLLSLSKDGVETIKNGTYWYYELTPMISSLGSVNTYDYDSLECTRSQYHGSLGKDECFATNGTQKLFLPMSCREFTKEQQDQVDANIKAAADLQLKANGIEAEPVIKKIWDCDMDGDGKKECFFWAEDQQKEGSGYAFLGYLKGESCQVLSGYFYPQFKEQVIPSIRPLVCDLNGDGKWTLLVYTNGGYESFTHYDFQAGNFIYCYDIIF